MLTITNKNGKVQKQVFIVGRYEITKGERAGRLIHMVRSIKQVKGQTVQHDYQVITFNDQDGRVTCDCESRGNCCHQDEVAFAGMRRYNTVKSRRVVAKPEATGQEKADELFVAVNAELARVQAETATPEEIAATQAHLLLPNDADQIAYFVQTKRRAEAIKPVPTPMVRNVSESWLLKGSRTGTFSGRVA